MEWGGRERRLEGGMRTWWERGKRAGEGRGEGKRREEKKRGGRQRERDKS